MHEFLKVSSDQKKIKYKVIHSPSRQLEKVLHVQLFMKRNRTSMRGRELEQVSREWHPYQQFQITHLSTIFHQNFNPAHVSKHATFSHQQGFLKYIQLKIVLLMLLYVTRSRGNTHFHYSNGHLIIFSLLASPRLP